MSSHRHDRELTLIGLARLDRGEPRNRLRHIPDLVEIGADSSSVHRMVLRRGAVGQNHGFAILIVAGHDSSGGLRHSALLPRKLEAPWYTSSNEEVFLGDFQ